MRLNRFPGSCVACGAEVPANAGHLVDYRGTLKPIHNSDSCRLKLDGMRAGLGSTTQAFGTTVASQTGTVAANVAPEDAAVDRLIELMAKKFTMLVPQLVEENLDRLSRTDTIIVGKMPAIKIDTAHKLLPTIVSACVAGVSPFMVGPAGSGKTTLAQQVAEVLKLKFYCESRVTSEFKLLGFIDAAGHVVRTQFREAYEHGGVFCFDEVDASDPDALTAFNSALSNGYCAFPDKLVTRHKDFRAIAAGNTFGRGADRQYVGRTQLDAATLDRFAIFEVEYDEQLELSISGNAEWARYVQSIRAAVVRAQVRHIVSPRASIDGAKLLAAGMSREQVQESCIWKGLDRQNRERVVAEIRSN